MRFLAVNRALRDVSNRIGRGADLRVETVGLFLVFAPILLAAETPQDPLSPGATADPPAVIALRTGDQGACCYGFFGSCRHTNAEQCEKLDGRFHGTGSDCVEGCGGACCLAGGGCELRPSPEHCAFFGEGIFQGESTECRNFDIDCPPTEGACCTEAGCGSLSPIDCRDQSGVFFGLGIQCFDVSCTPPEILGACCFNDGACIRSTRQPCSDAGGVHRGAGSTCEGEGCFGACCSPVNYLGCAITSPAYCNVTIDGTFQGLGTLCSDDDISCPAGACCYGYGCDELTQESCNVQYPPGSFQGAGTDCKLTCKRGACCRENGNCVSNETESFCELQGGVYQGDDTPCDAMTCRTGACCREEFCETRTPDGCSRVSGLYSGDGTTCDSHPCPTGACCRDGFCEHRTPAGCTAVGGLYRGDDTVCESAECPNGACCFDLSCQERNEQGCGADGGHFLGKGTQCSTGPCQGACCNHGGECLETLRPYCNGVFLGPSTRCEGADCPFGACCEEYPSEARCSQRTEQGCQEIGGQFQGADTACELEVCSFGACCRSGVGGIIDVVSHCRERSQEGCVQFGGEFQGIGISCDEPGCPFGACCLGDGCISATETQCGEHGGDFRGVDSNCDDGACRGACCAFGLACFDDAGRCNCEEQFGGEFFGYDTHCSFEKADQCRNELGACCVPRGLGPFVASDAAIAPRSALTLAGTGDCGSLWQCVDGITRYQCAAFMGVFRINRSCESADCPTSACPGPGDCCSPHRTLGCNDTECCRKVCAADPFCCVFTGLPWGDVCIALANRLCDDEGDYCRKAMTDINGDGVVDLEDYRLLQNDFGQP